MPRQYPRHYAIVEKGETNEIVVNGPVHETAILLSHPEAMGLNPPEPFDHSPFIIGEGEEEG